MAARKKKKKKLLLKDIPDILVKWVGTTESLLVHSAVFLLSFLSHWIFHLSLDLVLLVLTTVVSLEAIYLAIFIQRSVNQQSTRLEDVEDALDDVEESLDDVEESIDDVEESLASNKNHPVSRLKMEKSLDEIILELKHLRSRLDQNTDDKLN